jgi:hypothetical protein
VIGSTNHEKKSSDGKIIKIFSTLITEIIDLNSKEPVTL